MTDAKNDKQNPAQPENEKALVENAADTATQVVEGAAQLAEKARKSGERFVEEGRRRFPEAEEYYRQGREALSSQVQEGPLLAVLVAGALGYLLAYLIHGGGTPYRGRSDAPPFGRRPPINEAQRHGVQQDPRERAEALRRRT